MERSNDFVREEEEHIKPDLVRRGFEFFKYRDLEANSRAADTHIHDAIEFVYISKGSVKLTVIFAIGYIIVKTLISIITYDEKGGKEKKNAKNTSGKNSSKQKKTAPTSAKPTKATKKMKDEEYTSLFTPKSN